MPASSRTFEEFEDAAGSAGQDQGVSLSEAAGVERMEAVDVLDGLDRADDARRVEVRRQRQLHEHTVHLLVPVQHGDAVDQVVLSNVRRQANVVRANADL